MSASDQVEREVKLGAWPEFALPDLQGLADGVRVGAAIKQDLDAIYHDTPDLHLLRRGVTLRFRAGEPPADVWTIKLPSDAVGHGLARREITVPGERDVLPQQFADLARAWSFGRRLRPVARVRTQRALVPLQDARGRELAVLDDDAVTVLRGRRTVARFRELEVELSNGAPPELLAAVDERLRSAGAEKVPQIPKLGRALGRAATLPWLLEEQPLGPKATMAEAARAQITRHLNALVDAHAPMLLAVPGATASALSAARALATDLDVLEPLLSSVPARERETLDWLAAELAVSHELESLAERAAGLPAAESRALQARLQLPLERARARLARVLRDRRYTRMLDGLLRVALAAPPSSGPAGRRASAAGAKFARVSWRAVRDQPSERHLVELETTLELVAAHVRESASELERVRELREAASTRSAALGLAARLRRLGARTDGRTSWAAGMLAGLELARATAERERFEALWAEVSPKSSWAWPD